MRPKVRQMKVMPGIGGKLHCAAWPTAAFQPAAGLMARAMNSSNRLC